MDSTGVAARRSSRVWLPFVLGAWCVAVSYCWGRLAHYGLSPGSLRCPPRLDQLDVPIARSGNSHLLVMALHPKCPCSRASIGELEKLLSRFHDQLTCALLIYRPVNAPDDWLQTDLAVSARRLPRTRTYTDVGGRMSDKLGMYTSGSTVLYSPASEPEYWGGITAARGHSGDNPGSDAIAAVLRGYPTVVASQPVFGCQIKSDRNPSGN